MNSEILVKENMKLIYKISQSFYGVDKEDLIQAGIIGLLKAYKRYQENQDTKFSSYAYFDIYGEMYELATKKLIKTNKDTLKLYKIIEKTRYEEAQKIGKIPTNDEISNILNISKEMVDYACVSASVILSTDDENSNAGTFYESYSSYETLDNDDKILLKDSLDNLSCEERSVIKERYYNDKTQSDTARTLKMTQVMVSRLEKKGIAKMRRYITM